MGPWRACRRCVDELRAGGDIGDVAGIKVILYGSLAKTGLGHGTHKAVMLGLMGTDPATIDVGRIPEMVSRVRETHRLQLPEGPEIGFDPATDIISRPSEQRPFHANAMDVVVEMKDGTQRAETFYSVGGGFVVKEGEAGAGSTEEVPYPIASGAELREHCERAGRTISEIVRENERTRRNDDEIDAQLRAIWQTMKETVYHGCHTEGKLPGGLDVERRARRLSEGLLQGATYSNIDEWIKAIRSRKHTFQDVNTWVSCFAIATNEENAAFGRIVTAPTNGAAGVMPAVLLYHLCFDGGTDADAIPFLLTAGQIGILFKQGATLSAAMGGCQAEIGVSSAMASAALTEVMGGSVAQVLMAAEIAMEHHLGLTCDPVGGLVQIPCIERNSMGAIKAITASNIALASDPSQAKVPLDTVIKSMWDTALEMNEKYKETSEGGLAAHIPVSVIDC